MYVNARHSLILPLETDWDATLLGHQVELEWRLKVFSSTSNILFLNFTTPKYTFLFLKFTWYMLSIANEVNMLIFHCICLVYDTNMYFSNIHLGLLPQTSLGDSLLLSSSLLSLPFLVRLLPRVDLILFLCLYLYFFLSYLHVHFIEDMCTSSLDCWIHWGWWKLVEE